VANLVVPEECQVVVCLLAASLEVECPEVPQEELLKTTPELTTSTE